MAKPRDVYGNSAKTGYTIDFFALNAPGARVAFLACPFFSTYDPVRKLTERGCRVLLLVRLCSITPPPVLREALADPLVTVRYFTSRDFHAKLYIIDDNALVGSANLTTSGLNTNREVSVVLNRERDACFEELPGLFNWFWDYADVFNQEVLEAYTLAFRTIGNPSEEAAFEKELGKYVPPVAPPSAKVGSDIVSAKRSFLQSLRRKYDEQLIPAHEEVRALFLKDGRRRPEYTAGDPEIEINRFLGWARLVHAPGDSWKQTPLAEGDGRTPRIQAMLAGWHSAGSVGAGDMVDEDSEVEKIGRLRSTLGDPERISGLSYDELFETLICCHAFLELLRFVSGGLEGLRRDFAARNTLDQIKATLNHLLHGSGSSLERAYDCIYSEKYKLGRFGESCVMELVGWMDPKRPPINGRTIKALRFLGFDVSD
jgi:hypothetical protein